ncbi:hypothetical protein RRG08_020770, partial [Elysia crispata]
DKCTVDNFTSNFNLKQGNCFTFASSQDELRKTWDTVKPGPKNGLRLELNIEADEYLTSSTVGGIKVLIHDNLEYPFPEDGGLIVAPGFYTTIGIRKTNIKRLSSASAYGDCIDNNGDSTGENFFSDDGFRKALVKSTGKPAPSAGIRYCNISMFEDLDCVDRAQIRFSENKKLGCTDFCPPSVQA